MRSLLLHALLQFLTVPIAFYVMYLGLKRFARLHLGRSVAFPWKRHVVLGIVVLSVMLVGAFSGIALVYVRWSDFLVTEHGRVGVAMIPFILFGLISGIYMDRRKAKRTFLPLIHGIGNLVLLGMLVSQVVTGWTFMRALDLIKF
jgi:hypothetical protein